MQTGANKKVIPISLTADITFSNEQFKFKPRFNNTSAEPTFPLALLFPCLAIFTPQDAATNATAVDMLNVLAPSPPFASIYHIQIWSYYWHSQTFKSSSAIQHNSLPVTLLSKHSKKLLFEHQISHH